MIDAHLAAMALVAALVLLVVYAAFLGGMAYAEHQAHLRRDWDARQKERDSRRIADASWTPTAYGLTVPGSPRPPRFATPPEAPNR